MSQQRQPDRFAQIAQQQAGQRSALLVPVNPPDLPDHFLPLESIEPDRTADRKLPFKPLPRLETPLQLERELIRFRQRYARFQRELAPPMESQRLRIPVESFDWRLQTQADLEDPALPLHGGGEWSPVTIPHYGGPLGRARAFYRANFTLDETFLARGATFVHFQGVDYKAHVWINSAYLGSHEGFFAPFEFDFSAAARLGENTLLVIVENDAICMGNESWGEDGHLYEGDKIYAATGPGWDDPVVGWHHCPPGMGIYQAVWIESRAAQHIQDVFVRPVVEESRAEAWIEVHNCLKTRTPVLLELSVYGQNFRQSLHRKIVHQPSRPCGPGVNDFRVSFVMESARLWDPESPWLYQIQVRLLSPDGNVLDAQSRQFGMRSFRMDETADPVGTTIPMGMVVPNGMFYLNGKPTRLRGANTMGFEQQDVMKKDWDQLRDDILLAKICHMNFWRLTQRPVQDEVYALCDRLGLMTQTDLPLFAVLRRNQFAEAVRQAGEMERLVRSHPCNVTVTYINEPFPDASAPFTSVVDASRQLTRPELERFFQAADQVVLLANPDRVIKPVDGDYYPPAPGLPDNHCYCGWYNGHGVELGKLHKGYWQAVKPGWYYGCGEFGAEGLDPVGLMQRHYPTDWLPQSAQEESWTPDRIIKAQTGMFHYMWFDTQHSLADWVEASQRHQAWVTRLMTEAFRRDRKLISCAIHLFIDAFPAGWMKAIMDTERQPKPAYFAYREALSPLLANLRSDRSAFFSGETAAVEAWVCNDLPVELSDARLAYWVEMEGGKILLMGDSPARVPANDVCFSGFISFHIPQVKQREVLAVHLGILDQNMRVLHDTTLELQVYPSIEPEQAAFSRPLAVSGGEARRLVEELGIEPAGFEVIEAGSAVLVVDDFAWFETHRARVLQAVELGASLVFYNLPAGKYSIAGREVEVIPCGMSPVHFVSRRTGHPLVSEFAPDDFKFWADEQAGYVTPLLATTFSAEGWTPILVSGNGGWGQAWGPALAAAELALGKGTIRLCQIELVGRTKLNPAAKIFARRLLAMD